MWEKLLNNKIMFNALKERGRSKRYRSEVIESYGRKEADGKRMNYVVLGCNSKISFRINSRHERWESLTIDNIYIYIYIYIIMYDIA